MLPTVSTLAKPPPGHHEGQQRLTILGRALGVGLFEVLDEPVPQGHGVPERLHAQGPFGQAGEVVKVGDGAQGEHEVVVVQRVGVLVKPVADDDSARREVDRLDLPCEKADVAQQFPDRVDGVGQVEVAGGHFVQHGREQEEIFLADQRDFEVGLATLLEFEGRVEAPEAAAEDEDASLVHG